MFDKDIINSLNKTPKENQDFLVTMAVIAAVVAVTFKLVDGFAPNFAK